MLVMMNIINYIKMIEIRIIEATPEHAYAINYSKQSMKRTSEQLCINNIAFFPRCAAELSGPQSQL